MKTLLFLLCPALVCAAEIRVMPETTLAAAIERAAPGDTLVLTSGTYRERVRIEKTLTVRGEPGAMLEGSVPLAAKWSPSDLEGVLVTEVKDRPRGLLLGGKFLAEIRHDRAQEEGDWHWRTLLRRGPPLSGFAEIRGLWMVHPGEKRLYLRLPPATEPKDLAIVPSGDPLIHIAKARGVIIEGLAFSGGAEAIRIDEGAEECAVRRCRIDSYEATGILLTGGVTRCVVEECEITRGAFEEWAPSAKHDRANYEIWRIHKDVGRYDRNAIDLRRAGTGNRILRNRISRVFDGVTVGDSSVESLDKPLIDPNHGRSTEIAENTIEDTRDSGLELGVGCIEVHVHHNTLRRTHGGLRFKLPRTGPVFIHHNRLLDGAPFGIWFSMDASPAEGYVYHNTIEGGTQEALAIARDAAKRDFIAPRWHFVNNLILTPRGLVKKAGDKPHDFTAKNNATSAETAHDAGLDLSTYFHGKPLPGCEPGYFKGKAPDAGADER